MEEGMLQREKFAETDNSVLEAVVKQKAVQVKDKESIERIPHKIYIENGQRVAYTKQGSRIVFGTSDESMVMKEFAYFHAYPAEFEKIYGGYLKKPEIEKQRLVVASKQIVMQDTVTQDLSSDLKVKKKTTTQTVEEKRQDQTLEQKAQEAIRYLLQRSSEPSSPGFVYKYSESYYHTVKYQIEGKNIEVIREDFWFIPGRIPKQISIVTPEIRFYSKKWKGNFELLEHFELRDETGYFEPAPGSDLRAVERKYQELLFILYEEQKKLDLKKLEKEKEREQRLKDKLAKVTKAI